MSGWRTVTAQELVDAMRQAFPTETQLVLKSLQLIKAEARVGEVEEALEACEGDGGDPNPQA